MTTAPDYRHLRAALEADDTLDARARLLRRALDLEYDRDRKDASVRVLTDSIELGDSASFQTRREWLLEYATPVALELGYAVGRVVR